MAGLFLALILAAAVTLVWQNYKLQSLVGEMKKAMREEADTYARSLKDIHGDITQSFLAHKNEVTLEITKLKVMINKLDFEAISGAARQILSSAKRIEVAAMAVAALMDDAALKEPPELLENEGEGVAGMTKGGRMVVPPANEYAQLEPGERSFISQGKTARFDDLAQQEEADEL